MRYKKYPFVKQHDLKDCGVCSLLMVIEYYHGYVNLELLRDLTHTTKKGVTAYHLIETAKKLGFQAYGMKATLETFKPCILPTIAYIKTKEQLYHYVVIYKIDKKHDIVFLADPAIGFQKYSFYEFEKFFQNIFIVLYPVYNVPNFGQPKSLPHFYFEFLRRQIKNYTPFLLFSFGLGILTILFSFYFEWILEGIQTEQSISYFYMITLCFIFFYILQYFLEYSKKRLFLGITEKLSYLFTTTFIKKLLFLPYQYYYHRTTGEILQKLNDVVALETYFSKILLFLGFDVWILLICFIILNLIDGWILFLLLFYFLIEITSSFYFQKRYYQLSFDVKENQGKTMNMVSEMVHGFESVKGLHLESSLQERFTFQYLNLLKADIRYQLCGFYHQFLKDTIKEITFILIILVTILNNFQNSNLVVQLFTLQTILHYFLNSFASLQELVMEYPNVKQVYERISFLDRKEEVQEQLEHSIYGSIQINHLTYCYDGVYPLLEDLSFTIQSGEKVLLLGQTGCGKSTLLKLLMKYLEVGTNQIFIDYVDINMISKKDLERAILYVDQNGTLFTDTLYENITLHQNVDAQTFKEVVELCMVSEIAMKREIGYHMKLEENGFNLSGGERARIMLARALLKPWKILLIDEGFSALNPEMEYQILKRLFFQYRDRTIIVVSHRKTSMELFDHTYYIKHGKIFTL